MKVVIYMPSALLRLRDAIEFLRQQLPQERTDALMNRVLDRADSLNIDFEQGQYEPDLEHLGKGHRRLVEGHFKIIYRVEGDVVYVTDIFDSRQDPQKMRG